MRLIVDKADSICYAGVEGDRTDWSRRAKECSHIPSQVIASYFSIASFAAALLLGMAAGNSAHTILLRSIVLMVVAWFIGRIIGDAAYCAHRWALEPIKQVSQVKE